jgi:hypothetical protein
MVSNDQHPSPLLVPRVLWLAMLASTWIYGGVGYFVTQGAAPRGETAPPVLLAALGGAGLVVLIAAPIVRSFMLPRRERVTDGTAIDVAERMRRPAGRAAMARTFSAWLVAWALCEGVAIFGLVAVFLRQAPLEYLPFGAAADLGLIALAPRAALLEQIARALPDEPSR